MKLTRLRKPIRRVIEFPKGAVVVTLHPDGTLAFRGLRMQRRYAISLEPHVKSAFPAARRGHPGLELDLDSSCGFGVES